MHRIKTWFKKLFNLHKVELLQDEVNILKSKLAVKQEQINRTNAYYKKKLREVKKNTKK